jgi:hypothetical protein
MKRRILALLIALGLVALLAPAVVSAADTGEVSCTVTVYLVSLTVSDGDVDYGSLALEAIKNTALYDATHNTNGMATPQTQYVQNTGSVDVNFKVKTSDAIGLTDWTLGSTAGPDVFTHAFNVQGTPYDGGAAITFTQWTTAATYLSAGTTTAPTGYKYLELQIGMPTSASEYGEHAITVTVMAEAAS